MTNNSEICQMPSKEEMLARLKGTGFYGLKPEADAFYDRFIGLNAGQKRGQHELNESWGFARIDALSEVPADVLEMIDITFNKVMAAVTPDSKAKEFYMALASLDLDRDIESARGKTEAPITEADIQNLGQLAQYGGTIVKYTMNHGKSWKYGKLYKEPERFAGGSFGYSINSEILPNSKGQSRHALTDRGFEKGLIVRPTNDEEVQGMLFSYDSI